MKKGNKQEQSHSSSLVFSHTFLSDGQFSSNEALNCEIEPESKSKILQKNYLSGLQLVNSKENTDLIRYINKIQESKKKQQVQNTLDNSEEDFLRIKNRKILLNNHIKTETCNVEEMRADEIAKIKLQNQILKDKLIRQQKRIITLEPYEGEVQYLKKICFLQNEQIQKLRKQLTNLKCQKLQLSIEEHKRIKINYATKFQSDQEIKDPILISDDIEKVRPCIKKKQKCIHKQKDNRRQASNHLYKTQMKGCITCNQNYSVPLKDREEIQNQLQNIITSKHGKHKKQKNVYS